MIAEKQMTDVKASYLSTEDLKIAASLLYQSYHDDPVFMEIFEASKDDYEQRLRASIREELNAFWQAGQPMVGLYLDESLVGVACLNGPDERVHANRFWHWRLKMLLSAGYFSMKQMIEKEQAIMDAVPLNSFHILSFIAIHPLHQHHGFGHYLMSAVNTVLDDHPSSEGVAVFVTNKKYQQFFDDVEYQKVTELTVGKVSGTVMIHYREQA